MSQLTIVTVVIASALATASFANTTGHCSEGNCWDGTKCVTATTANTFTDPATNKTECKTGSAADVGNSFSDVPINKQANPQVLKNL